MGERAARERDRTSATDKDRTGARERETESARVTKTDARDLKGRKREREMERERVTIQVARKKENYFEIGAGGKFERERTKYIARSILYFILMEVKWIGDCVGNKGAHHVLQFSHF